MALNEYISTGTAASEPKLPGQFPQLPDEVVKRFPKIEEYHRDVERFWRKTRSAVLDSNEDVIRDAKKTAQSLNNLSKSFQSLDFSGFASAIDNLSTAVGLTGSTSSHIVALEASVNTPVTGLLARVNVIETTYATDTDVSASISSAIATEVTNRNSAITSAVASETTARSSAIAAETSARTSAISSVTTAYQAADATLQTDINTRATTASLTTESNTRATADTALSSRASALEASVNTPTTGLLARVSTIETTYATDTDVTSATTSITSAYLAADAKKITVAGSAPASPNVNDLWIDTSDNNKPKYWTGAAWTYRQDGVLAALVTTETSARVTADGNLEGKYSIKVTTGNRVTGMNITSASGPGTDISDISFIAGSFKVYNNTTDVAPFQIVGSKIRFTGNVEIDGALVLSGTLSLTDLSNRSLANLDSSANSKLTSIATGADVTLSAVNGGLNVTGGGITLSSGGAIKGGASDFSTGTGFFLGYESGQYKFRVGNPSGPRIQWDGSNWSTVNLVQTGASGAADAIDNITNSAYTAISGLNATVTGDGYKRVVFVTGNLEGDPSVGRNVALKVVRDASTDIGSVFNIYVPANAFVYVSFFAVDTSGPTGSPNYAVYANRPTSGTIAAELHLAVI